MLEIESDLLIGHKSWEEAYNSNCFNHVTVEQLLAPIPDEEDFEEFTEEEEDLEEYMVAAKAGPNHNLINVDLGNREIDVNFDWNEAYNRYNFELLLQTTI